MRDDLHELTRRGWNPAAIATVIGFPGSGVVVSNGSNNEHCSRVLTDRAEVFVRLESSHTHCAGSLASGQKAGVYDHDPLCSPCCWEEQNYFVILFRGGWLAEAINPTSAYPA